ncbi:SDR family oxidoreductase [Mucilaginibacter agri]|uniref:SDR family NAD(P)-dependent oxidoreductase n=1 Tax=Mucilaginibacter agri TaxID=2695265 RepID=A0A965ZFD4_9SPHI|nr:SDR family oxidoreductase [Mucilaginibacter agri]NCD68984.1 SDR family NAD(P)-dependent oxidoreductase [Mucilaginibacter agri]
MSIKTTLITGATSGIGKETALALAKKDHALYLLVRNTVKGEQLKDEIIGQTGNRSVYVIPCDLSELESVRTAVSSIVKKLTAINVLINNAGGIFDQHQKTSEGFEKTFATNHLGHFLLTMSLMPLLVNGQARIINVSSAAHRLAKPEWLNDAQFEHKEYSEIRAYALSKLFNIYFTKSLVDKYGAQGITSYVLHPGVVYTNFGEGLSGFSELIKWLSRPFMISPAKGAETSIYLASQQGIEQFTGQYFIKSKPATMSSAAKDIEARERLWDMSKRLTGI